MSRTEKILKELNELPISEIEMVYNEMSKRLNKLHKFHKVLDKVRGTGKGVWGKNSNDSLNDLRNERES